MNKHANKQSQKLIIAFVAPIGCDLEQVGKELIENVKRLKVQSQSEENIIKISKELEFLKENTDLVGYEKYVKLMDVGDQKRNSKWENATLAKEISDKIDENYNEYDFIIIHQLKTPEEIDYLRRKYVKEENKAFFVISIFDTKPNRINRLIKKIKSSEQNDPKISIPAKAQDLIDRDEKDSSKKHGQNVRDAFVLADFFVDSSLRSEISDQIDRIVKAIFCYPHLSPTKEEYGMYLAEAGALRTRDLSRQVGAAILDDTGAVLSIGCNEVPKAYSGCYWENDRPDNRDFVYGEDSNYKFRDEILEEFIRTLCKLQEFSDETKEKINKKISSRDELVSLIRDNHQIFKNTRIMNLIEFGRSMHAEVAAISEAARRGVSLNNSTLFVTLFPCHLCARYIISVGIKKVIFIEPYPKSLTTELYSSEIELSPSCDCPGKIVLKPFIGIAPRIYRKIFIYHYDLKSNDKKQLDGMVKSWVPNLSKWISSLDI